MHGMSADWGSTSTFLRSLSRCPPHHQVADLRKASKGGARGKLLAGEYEVGCVAQCLVPYHACMQSRAEGLFKYMRPAMLTCTHVRTCVWLYTHAFKHAAKAQHAYRCAHRGLVQKIPSMPHLCTCGPTPSHASHVHLSHTPFPADTLSMSSTLPRA